RDLRGPATRRLWRARNPSGRPSNTQGSNAFPQKTKSVVTLSGGPMDTGTPTLGRRCAWTGWQRRPDCARGDDAPLNSDTAGLSDAIWCRIDRGDGCALGAHGLADRTAGSPPRVCAHPVAGCRQRLDRARLVLGLPGDRSLSLAPPVARSL